MALPGTLRILIAGGGTGGHLFPGLAIAETFQRLAPGAQVRFAGSAYGIERQIVPQHGYRLYRIAVRGLYQVSWRRRLWVLAMLPVAFLQCMWLLLTWRPHLVLGVGGYASGPVLATALLLGRRCVIQEQNTAPGLTNRLLGRFVQRAFVVQDEGAGVFRHAVVAGSPVRQAILALREYAVPPRPVPVLLVLGGSQGARAINQAMLQALPRLKAWGRPLRIVHQCGPAHAREVQAGYAPLGLDAQVLPFIQDMAQAYAECRLIVSRAGASAVNEFVAARRASILVPIPGTSGDHQLKNAQRLAQAGAARLLEQAHLTGDALAALILELLEDPATLDRMEQATDALFPGDAARRIVEECLALLR